MASYIVIRSDDYLMHHGIKGQKWGQRRFQNPDGTLTAEGRKHYGVAEGGSKEMSRDFNRDVRRLNKLQKRTDTELQARNAAKYSKRAKIAGGTALGLAGAAVGSHFGTAAENAKASLDWKSTYNTYDDASSRILSTINSGLNLPGGMDKASFDHLMGLYKRANNDASNALYQWSKLKKQSSFGTAGVATRTKILAGGAAVASGYAAYSAIRSKIAKSRLTDVGHQKAVEKYQKQYSTMIEKYGNTPYSELLKKMK